jgi:hypothetical protein
MSRRNSRLKVFIYGIAAVVGVFLINLILEMLGGDIKALLEKQIGITTEILLGVLAVICVVAFIIASRDIWKSSKSNDELLSDQDIEPDIKKFFYSLKERYQKRYESKLDGRFEITLEVSENWDGHKTQTFNERYDKDAKISEAFPTIKNLLDTKDGLLIVGEPGAGKTILLLKVALNLLDKTNLAEKEAFPVIFNLASWNEEYKDFGEWLNTMLVSGNGLSKDFAERLLHDKRLILLLDGLDELARKEKKVVANEKRAACLAALNNYLDGEKNVICCRIDEFVAMRENTAQDAPVSAKVEVLNLTEAEVLNALEHARNHKDSKHHASAKNLSELFVEEENAALRKVLCTPFYFTVALEVFYKHIPDEMNLPNNEDRLRTFLIEKYLESKLNKTPNPNNFERRKTRKWLKWLAKLMEDYQIVTFELADLQPMDLSNKSTFSGVGSIFICIVFFLIYISFIKFHIIFAWNVLIFPVAWYCLYIVELDVFKDLSKNKIARYDFLKFLKLFAICFLVILSLLLWALLADLFAGRPTPYKDITDLLGFLGIVILFSFFPWSVFLAIRMHKYKKYNNFAYLQSNYQRIFAHSSVNIVLFTLLLVILLTSLIAIEIKNSELVVCMAFQAAFLFLGLRFLFGISILWHLILRYCLFLEGSMPLKYATLLDYAAEARILEKDGGHWRFRHQNLQEYFASLPD